MVRQDIHNLFLNKRIILLITLISTVLLTISYVLGVHIGRQGLVTNCPTVRGVGENLQVLPALISDQIKAIGESQQDKNTIIRPSKEVKITMYDDPVKIALVNSKNEPVDINNKLSNLKLRESIEKKSENSVRWTVQLLSTRDLLEAQRTVARANTSGFHAVILSENELFKVRLAKSNSKEMIDAIVVKLKKRGFNPFAIRVR